MSNYHTTYAEFLGISAIEFHKLNVLNPTIYTDVRLFIDPRLLKHSQYDIFSNMANTTFENYYKNLADCIRAYLIEKDSLMQLKMKREIIKKLTAHEPIGLGLGYSKNSIAGQGIGRSNATILFKNAVELYKRIPSIGESAFSLINLLSEGIGADYIGDITANIIIKELYTFTEHIAKELGIKTELFRLGTNMYRLPIHPNSKRKVFPILLVPKDILSDLPRDVDLEDMFDGFVNDNDTIRNEVNEQIVNILKSDENKKDKQSKLFELLKDNQEHLERLARYLKTVEGETYNFDEDRKSLFLREKLLGYLDKNSMRTNIDDNLALIDYVINNFEKFVRNNNNLKRELLWIDEEHHKTEKAWQQVFHLYVHEFLSNNDIDVTPEAETNSGPVDFKFSRGNKLRVLVEIKLSKNNPIAGLTKQLEKYKECTENVKAAYFVCFNVHKKKQSQEILAELNAEKARLNLDTKIIVIDGNIKSSASNL